VDGENSSSGKTDSKSTNKIDSNALHHKQISNSDKVWTSLVAGAFAGALAKTTIAPLDRTKIYYQTSSTVQYSARSAYAYLAKTYKRDGFFSLWRGNSATMARIVPYASVQFTSHEQWKQILQVDHKVHDRNKEEVLRFISGALAGITAQSLTYPLDMTRARLAMASKEKYRTLREVFVKIYKEEGILTLYRGYTATMLGVIPYAGMSFYCYETLKRKWADAGQPMTPLSRLCFGAMAGVLGQTTSYPLDIVRRRLQVIQKVEGQSSAIIPMLFKIAREEGVMKGLYKGLSMNWLKGPVAAGISFSVFDLTQSFLRTHITHT